MECIWFNAVEVIKMSLGTKLYELRRKQGLSQEEVGEALHVSRQAISRWETDQSTPAIDNLVPLSKLYKVSLDELLDVERAFNPYQEAPYEPRSSRYHYEYKSETTIFGMPLVHVNIGAGACRAKAIFAFGNIATGIVSFGLLSLGFLSFGLLSLSLLAFGMFSVGGVACGGISLGILALGGIAVGYVSMGGIAIGVYAMGGMAFASKVAIGGYARGYIAVGQNAHGVITFVANKDFSNVNGHEVYAAIVKAFPQTKDFIVHLLTFFLGR